MDLILTPTSTGAPPPPLPPPPGAAPGPFLVGEVPVEGSSVPVEADLLIVVVRVVLDSDPGVTLGGEVAATSRDPSRPDPRRRLSSCRPRSCERICRHSLLRRTRDT